MVMRKNNFKEFLLITILMTLALTGSLAAQDNNLHNGQYLLSYCKNPSMSDKSRGKQIEGNVTAIYDISPQGKPFNIRLTEVPEGLGNMPHVVKALSRWRYYAFLENGKEAARTDVTQNFVFRKNKNEIETQDCALSFLPEPPSTEGDPLDYKAAIKSCPNLIIPHQYDRKENAFSALMEYDISLDGRVENPRIVQKASKKFFDELVLNAVSEIKYFPFKKAGAFIERKNISALFSYGNSEIPFTTHVCFHAEYGSSAFSTEILNTGHMNDFIRRLDKQ